MSTMKDNKAKNKHQIILFNNSGKSSTKRYIGRDISLIGDNIDKSDFAGAFIIVARFYLERGFLGIPGDYLRKIGRGKLMPDTIDQIIQRGCAEIDKVEKRYNLGTGLEISLYDSNTQLITEDKVGALATTAQFKATITDEGKVKNGLLGKVVYVPKQNKQEDLFTEGDGGKKVKMKPGESELELGLREDDVGKVVFRVGVLGKRPVDYLRDLRYAFLRV